MTREEKQKAIDALKISSPIRAMTNKEFNDYIQTLNKIMDWLEQEPILDKIRAEIEQIKEAEYQIYGKGSWRFVDKCLDIIDKYKAESEDKE